jgi:hypothetical protein
MPRPLVTVVLVGTVAVGMFAAGAITAAVRGWGSPLVSVAVRNDTSRELRQVDLHYSTCGGASTISVRALAPATTHTFTFLVCGEGGYALAAIDQNGKPLASAQGYVESGYRINAYVEPAAIRSETATYRF